MGKINWNDFQARAAELEARQQQMNSPYVGFFTLKNDGDEAIVRIMHDSPEDFDILAVHQTTVDGKFRNVSCLRSPSDPMDMCPFCAANKKFATRLYIHLIQYVRDENNQIVAQPKVWERSTAYAKQLAEYINEYGPLSDMIFKIKRSGAKGSMDTTYTIIPANAKLYPEDIYVKDAEALADYQALGHAVLDKNYEEMMVMLDGAPTTQQAATPARLAYTPAPVRPTFDQVAQAATPAYAPVPQQQPVAEARTYREPTAAPSQPAYAPVPQQPAAGDVPASPQRRSYF